MPALHLRIACGFLLLLALAGCGPRPVPPAQQGGQGALTLEQARVLSGLPGRYVHYRSPLKFLFARPMVASQVVGQADGRELLVLEPRTPGRAVWRSRTELEFQPGAPLQKFKTYRGELQLSVLVDDPTLAPVSFDFDAVGNEVARLEAEFKPAPESGERKFVFAGKVDFNQPMARETVFRSLSLRGAGGPLALTVEGSDPGQEFTFSAPAVAQTARKQTYELALKAADLDLAADISQTLTVPAARRFQVERIEPLPEGEEAGFRVDFTEALASAANPDGFVKVTPAVSVQLKPMEHKLYVLGDFQANRDYTVEILAGLKDRWGEPLPATYRQQVRFADQKPRLRFVNPGLFLPTDNQQQVAFETLNLKDVHVEVLQVFAGNLGQFMQTETLRNRYAGEVPYFNQYEFRRVGVGVATQKLHIGTQKNKLVTQALDLSRLLDRDRKGLFVVRLWAERADLLYSNQAEREAAEDEEYWNDSYYTNPYKQGYLERHATALLQVVVSDLGLTVKRAGTAYWVFANHLQSTKPLAGVRVRLVSYQNQTLAEGATDLQGLAEFKDVKEDVFYVEGESGGQRSLVKLEDMAWNLSSFDIDGSEGGSGQNRAFVFLDRGVYRPGDAIHLSLIVRNHEGTFPENHPVTVKFYNPRNQLASEATNRQARDGFYAFTLQTQPESLTGDWRAEITAGAAVFHEQIKVETVIPNRLKVALTPAKAVLDPGERELRLSLASSYLYGAPASELQAEVSADVLSDERRFNRFPDFNFTDEAVRFRPWQSAVWEGTLDSAGEAQFAWALPAFGKAPSGLRARLTAKVLEKGGRFTQHWLDVDINPFGRYVGLRRPAMEYGYVAVPQDVQTDVVLVAPDGRPVPGRTLAYRLYRNRQWWWWEYRDDQDRRLKFKTDRSTDLAQEGVVVTGQRPARLALKIEEPGEYLLEVADGDEGHVAGYFFEASRWGETAGSRQDAGDVILKADRDLYHPGDKAVVRFPVPGEGRVLFTLERGNDVLDRWWETLKPGQRECVREISITSAMLPTVYVSVSILQPHAQVRNDLPLRFYGVLPLKVEDASTRRPLSLRLPETLKPNETFTVEVQSEDRKPYQATLAVVDEGLLGLTAFATPDPWRFFFQKMRLAVRTYDLYGFVIGANPQDLAKLFAIGGGEALQQQQSVVQARRFEPVALFQGPLRSDARGKLTATFTLPRYIGAVRVMAVAAQGQAYGSAEKTVTVRQALMVQPTLPRVLGPEESFELPVDVIAMQDGLGQVEVAVETSGPVSVSGEAGHRVELARTGERTVRFRLQTPKAVGVAKVTVRARAGKFTAEAETEIAVRPSAPRLTRSQTLTVRKGETVRLRIPDDGLLGTNQASVSIQRLPQLGLERHLRWLIQYPYGCLEQTTSSVFPQLYLRDWLTDAATTRERIDQNIQAGIERLKHFALPSGGFSYWPGGSQSDGWATNYAGHFLLEAKKKGYAVPAELLAKWLQFQQSQALRTEGDVKERVYRVYLLALAGQAAVGPMNLLKENNLKGMEAAEQWLLAAAYQAAGSPQVAREIASQAGFGVREYTETGGTYGSGLRDRAIMLETLVLFGRLEKARELFESLGESLSADNWYSTQTISYCLLAMGKYLQALDADYGSKRPRLAGYFQLPEGKRETFDTQEVVRRLALTKGFGQEVEVYLDPKASQDPAYVTLTWSGVPLAVAAGEGEEERLALGVDWFAEDGSPLDIGAVRQGQSLYGRISVRQSGVWQHNQVENLALVQILPSGWEIENLRLSGENLPEWLNADSLAEADYLDIRDDRLIWFFGRVSGLVRPSQFVFKANAITVGKFLLPATHVEAMYDHAYRATLPGKPVEVLPARKKE
ncbi:MAG: MG2 domain-containing protein [candidate division FCPU426 bacterium]